MRFQKTIYIDAPRQHVWEVLSDLGPWPQRIETVDTVELLASAAISTGSRVRHKQPKLPEDSWEVTAWNAPTSFTWTQKPAASPASPITVSRTLATGDRGSR